MPQDIPIDLTFDVLNKAIAGHAAAIRCRSTLQPAAGEGTKVFPPTHSGGKYATEQRRIPGREQPVECVLLDSVQSQANRIEEALQDAVDRKPPLIELPLIVVDFGNEVADVQRVTSLQAPHRAADAILRDSLLDGTPFRKSDIGERITESSLSNATALFEFCPHALVLGIWDSTGPKGGLGAKFARAMVSEVVGIDAVNGVRTKSRIDPLQVSRFAGPLYRRSDGTWTVNPDEGIQELDKQKRPTGKVCLLKQVKNKDVFHSPGPLFERRDKAWSYDPALAIQKPKNEDEVDCKLFGKTEYLSIAKNQLGRWRPSTDVPESGKPSTANHGNVTPDFKDENGQLVPGGVTISHAEHTAVLSLPQLRRLRFPIDGKFDSKRDDAARTVLASLALVGLTLAAERGFDLRSRCLLFPNDAMRFELLETPGKPTALSISSTTAIAIFKQAVEAAKKLGLPWNTKPIVLKPSPQLIELVKRSQAIAANSIEGGDE
jgi:CRISPR-associated protein Csb1